MSFQIVLVEPQIPPNTGNIGRLCLATQSQLHLVEPLGFSLSEKAVRRAGLDYWKHVQPVIHPNYGEFRKSLITTANCWYFSKFAQKNIFEAKFQPGDFLIFGKETTGLGPEVVESVSSDRLLKIPMQGHEQVRSLNLAGCVHIALFEAIRQTEFSQL